MDIKKLRQQIDKIDNDLVKLFTQRMEAAADIADYKKQNNLPILDSAREREVISQVAQMAGEENSPGVTALYNLIMELSRAHQQRIHKPKSSLADQVAAAIEGTPQLFPESAIVACQGVEGAFSQQAAEKLFARPEITYFNTFESVFTAVEKGMCRYGVLPLENSSAGSVNSVYSLMMKHNFKIVRSTRVKIDHCLVANAGTKIEDIREIVSHEQAINQCAEFIAGLTDVRITICGNTAEAAKIVAESGRGDVAAISSASCSKVYGLNLLNSSVQDRGNNYTRFICISRDLEVYPGADKTSLMMSVAHKPGSLYNVLSRFYALGINLVKLESRPIAQREFEFMFYFDLASSIYSPQFVQLLGDLESSGEEFRYLGTYSEMV